MGNCKSKKSSALSAEPRPLSMKELSLTAESIAFMPFDKLKTFSEYPRLGLTQQQRKKYGLIPLETLQTDEQKQSIKQNWHTLALEVGGTFTPAKDVLVSINDIDISSSLVVFVSHRWLRYSPDAPGYKMRPHADDENNNQYKLVLEGINKLKATMCPTITNCYVWIDFSCINQDGDACHELDRLDEIIEWADCIFTPVVDPGHRSWSFPAIIYNYFDDYKAKNWRLGDDAYLTRGWCRLEMLTAQTLPMRAETIEAIRLQEFQGQLATALSTGSRYHCLYGTKESFQKKDPLPLPPLTDALYDKFDPEKGKVSSEADREKISELIKHLHKYHKPSVHKAGYAGKYDTDGNKSGFGSYTSPNGDVYAGDWKNGVKEGQGIFTYANGDVYIGEFKNNYREGQGQLTTFKGDEYTGMYVKGVKAGQGTCAYANGDTYVGTWGHDVKEGRGTYTYPNGDEYVGEFKEDQKHGQGVMKYVSGDVYSGQFKNGLMSGRGCYTYANHDKYEGEFRNHVKEGQGLFTWANGNTFEGPFSLDTKHGKGTFTYNEARKRTSEREYARDKCVQENFH